MPNKKRIAITAIALVLIILLLCLAFIFWPKPVSAPEAPITTPTFAVEEIINGLSNPWDIAFIDEDTFLFTERDNKINLYDKGEVKLLAEPNSTHVEGEGGMMSISIHPNFEENRYVYTCSNVENGEVDVRVHRWELSEEMALGKRDNILWGIPANTSGRHSGCQLEFGPDGYLWIGTGDAAEGTNSQDPKSLGGKILRVDDRGKGVAGNLADPFDNRIYSYGHRNIQGIAFLRTTSSNNPVGVSAEHGPDIDDEINMLQQGNFGWDPIPGYNEDVPMTDLEKYPDAIEAVWSSGKPTLAISGITQITGEKWGIWDGAIAVSALRGSQVLILKFNGERLEEEATILQDIGRIRTIQQGPDENLYVLTDNGSGDKIIKLIAN